MTDPLVQSVVATVLFAVFGFILLAIARKAVSQRRDRYKDAKIEEFINIALCETRNGIKTHYHKLGFKVLNYGGYPVVKKNSSRTLCGVEVGWDMKNQDVEATCVSCVKSLAAMAREAKS